MCKHDFFAKFKLFLNTVRHHTTFTIYPFRVSSSHRCIVIQDFNGCVCYTDMMHWKTDALDLSKCFRPLALSILPWILSWNWFGSEFTIVMLFWIPFFSEQAKKELEKEWKTITNLQAYGLDCCLKINTYRNFSILTLSNILHIDGFEIEYSFT